MITTRRVPDAIMYALVLANNQRLTDNLGSLFHLDQTNASEGTDYSNPTITRLTVTPANATDLPTSTTLVNAIKAACQKHFKDDIAHNTATSAQITIADGTDLTSDITLANDLKSRFNTHLAAANVHFTNDATNTVAAANATDQPTLLTLINEIKGDMNAHMASAPVGAFINLVSA